MTTQMPSLCRACVRREATADDLGTPTTVRCEAFPGGIPADIARGADHHAPRGDEVDGLVFAQADTDEARRALDSWRRFTAA